MGLLSHTVCIRASQYLLRKQYRHHQRNICIYSYVCVAHKVEIKVWRSSICFPKKEGDEVTSEAMTSSVRPSLCIPLGFTITIYTRKTIISIVIFHIMMHYALHILGRIINDGSTLGNYCLFNVRVNCEKGEDAACSKFFNME
jgi:hypothetical protein